MIFPKVCSDLQVSFRKDRPSFSQSSDEVSRLLSKNLNESSAVSDRLTVSARWQDICLSSLWKYTFAVNIVQIVGPSHLKIQYKPTTIQHEPSSPTSHWRRRDKLAGLTLGLVWPFPELWRRILSLCTSYFFSRLTRVFFCQNSVNLFLCIVNCCELNVKLQFCCEKNCLNKCVFSYRKVQGCLP